MIALLNNVEIIRGNGVDRQFSYILKFSQSVWRNCSIQIINAFYILFTCTMQQLLLE